MTSPDDTPAIPTVDGTNVLLTDTDRNNALATSGTGNFRVIVTFSEQVFPTANETDVATAVEVSSDLGTVGDGDDAMELYCWECGTTGFSLIRV